MSKDWKVSFLKKFCEYPAYGTGISFFKSPEQALAVESFIESLLTQQRQEIMEDTFRRIQYCGFGAMEWRMKLIDKLKDAPTVVRALSTKKEGKS